MYITKNLHIYVTIPKQDHPISNQVRNVQFFCIQFSKTNIRIKFQIFILPLKILTTMISDQGDKISFFDINQSRFFVCSPSIKKYPMWKNILEQDNNFLCIQIA